MLRAMRRLNSLPYLLPLILFISLDVLVMAKTTKNSTDTEHDSMGKKVNRQPVESATSPVPFSSRQGTSENTKVAVEHVQSSDSTFGNNIPLKNSSTSATSSKSRVAYHPASDENPGFENTPNVHQEPVLLHLLDENSVQNAPQNPFHTIDGPEGRSRLPPQYYENYPIDYSQQNPQQASVKGYPSFHSINTYNGNEVKQKKRFEYKVENSQPHTDPVYFNEGESTKSGQRNNQPENSYGGFQHGDFHYGYPYRYSHHDVVGRALQFLIPSALLLTGVSALFPNRIKVPTNDISKHPPHRQKRSATYESSLGYPNDNDWNDDKLFYNFESSKLDSLPEAESYIHSEPSDSYANSENSKDFSERSSKGYHYNHDDLNRFQDTGFVYPSTPRQYDRIHFGPQMSYDHEMKPPKPVSTMMSMAQQSVMNNVIQDARVTNNMKKKHFAKQRNKLQTITLSRPLPTSAQDYSTEAPAEEYRTPEFRRIPDNSKPVVNKPSKSIPVSINYDPEAIQQTIASASKNTEKLRQLLHELEGEKSQVFESDSSRSPGASETPSSTAKPVDLSPDGPVMGLISSYAVHDGESPECQKRALCELTSRGKLPTATKFESFLWSLATLVPEQFSRMYSLHDIFEAVKNNSCETFVCPNLLETMDLVV